MEERIFAFDPDFSEYNPLYAELKNREEEKENFFISLIKKFTAPVAVQAD